jgi:hypothetical protein
MARPGDWGFGIADCGFDDAKYRRAAADYGPGARDIWCTLIERNPKSQFSNFNFMSQCFKFQILKLKTHIRYFKSKVRLLLLPLSQPLFHLFYFWFLRSDNVAGKFF